MTAADIQSRLQRVWIELEARQRRGEGLRFSEMQVISGLDDSTLRRWVKDQVRKRLLEKAGTSKNSPYISLRLERPP